jgi:predicted N-acetyltransferase YhbS
MILARLAVDSQYHGQGLGRALLKDAMLRTAQAADIAGIRCLLVHANPKFHPSKYDFSHIRQTHSASSWYGFLTTVVFS